MLGWSESRTSNRRLRRCRHGIELGAASGFGSRPGLGLTETRLSTIVPPEPLAAGGAAPEPGWGGETLPPGPGGMNGSLKAVTAAFPGRELTAAHEPASNNAPRSPARPCRGGEEKGGEPGSPSPRRQRDHPKPNRSPRSWTADGGGGAGAVAISRRKLCCLVNGGFFSPPSRGAGSYKRESGA